MPITLIMEYDEVSMAILGMLRSNARQSLSSMAAGLNVSISTVYSRLESIEADLIKRYTMLWHLDKTGHFLALSFIAKNANGKASAILESSPFVNNLSILKGDMLQADCIFENMGQYYELFTKLKKASGAKLYELHHIKEIKREGFMSTS